MEDEIVSRKLNKFNAKREEDFVLWTLRFETLLESKDLLEIIETDPMPGGEEVIDEERKKKVNKVKMLLSHSLGDVPLRTVAGERKNPFKMYEKLKERYATSNTATRVQLQTELHHKRYKDGATMSAHIDSLETLFNRLDGMNSTVDESMQVAILLASFGSTQESPYGAVVTALQTMKDEDLTWEKATARLLQEYDTRQAVVKDSKSAGSSGQSKQERALKTKSHVQCYKCGKFGHYKRECRSREKQDKVLGGNGQDRPHGQKAFLVRRNRNGSKDMVVDSAASSHMFFDKTMFSRLKKDGSHRVITLGDGRTVSAKMTGSVFIQTRVGEQGQKGLVLNDALYVPSLDSNLVSCSALDKDGYDVNFADGKCTISRDDELICTGVLRDGLYFLSNVIVGGEHANVAAEMIDGERLWHDRFGHTNVTMIKEMARKETVVGLDFNVKPEAGVVCVPCTLGKQTRLNLRGRSKKSLTPGEVFYTDVCGPLPVKSIGGNNYFVTFTDAMSSYKTVRIVEAKSNVLEAFLSVQRLFERKNDCKVKTFVF